MTKIKLLTSQEFRQEKLNGIINRGKTDFSSISIQVRKIIADIKENGDKALLQYTKKFDEVQLTKETMKVPEDEIKDAHKKLTREETRALNKVASNIARFHKKQMEDTWSLEVTRGVAIGQVTRPLSSIGVYAPGGNAVYPSSILMCVIPAKIAGVNKVIICSPPDKDGNVNPALLAAAHITGVSEVFKVGGAQAITAMAYGTETIPKVEKIIGPGNVFVTAAKIEVSNDVAIDVPAGPSEVLIIADKTANASFIASDLLAQAEHDPEAWAILLTTSKTLAKKVRTEVYRQMKMLSRVEIAESSIKNHGLLVIVKNIKEAVKYTNLIAPEHLHIQTKNPTKVFKKVRNAGAVFLGTYSLIAFGDYSSGLNHVLPTGGYAKCYSGLSSRDFLKTMNFMQCSRRGFLKLKSTTITLAKMEGFDGHARSVSIRDEYYET